LTRYADNKQNSTNIDTVITVRYFEPANSAFDLLLEVTSAGRKGLMRREQANLNGG
jgi:hypothetical protein